jgi:hypothetical protein
MTAPFIENESYMHKMAKEVLKNGLKKRKRTTAACVLVV